MYTALVIGTVFIIALGVPAVEWLSRRIRKPTPKEEDVRRRIEEARRRIDRFPY